MLEHVGPDERAPYSSEAIVCEVYNHSTFLLLKKANNHFVGNRGMVLGTILQGDVAFIFAMLTLLHGLNEIYIDQDRLQGSGWFDVVFFVEIWRILFKVGSRTHHLNQVTTMCNRLFAVFLYCHGRSTFWNKYLVSVGRVGTKLLPHKVQQVFPPYT
jgi:hypothetical protein